MSEPRHTVSEQHSSPDAPAPGEGASRAGAPQPGAPSQDAARSAQTSDLPTNDRAPEPPAGEASGDGGAAEVEGDLDELVRTAAQRDEYLALAQRTQADFENYRKRVARESSAAHERGMAALAKELLPALDNLDRALAEASARSAEQGEDPLLEGVRLVRSELAAALARTGIESFSPDGEAFDPALHEAMATVERPAGECASGTVVEVYQPGYRLGASVIRPARVVVSA